MMEPEEPKFWEPWHPQSGDRVRIRLNPECQQPNTRHSLSFNNGNKTGHSEIKLALNGSIGTVNNDYWYGGMSMFLRDRGHYGVTMDEPFEEFDQTWHVIAAAAVELEPVEVEDGNTLHS